MSLRLLQFFAKKRKEHKQRDNLKILSLPMKCLISLRFVLMSYISTRDYDICWFSLVPKCNDVEYKALIQCEDISFDIRDEVPELEYKLLQHTKFDELE